MILDFIRNKIVEVEPLPDGSLRVSWNLKDSLLEAEVKLGVRPPDLEITETFARLKRFPHQKCLLAIGLLEAIKGVRIGSGLRKIVQGLLGGPQGCGLMSNAVLEAGNAAILHFTRYTLQPRDNLDDDKIIALSRERVKTNPRMVGSCVVYGENSPVMQGHGS